MKLKNVLGAAVAFLALVSAPISFADMSTDISDTAITATVKAKIFADSSLSSSKISVATAQGIVTLSGQVDSDTQAVAATELAQSTSGVKDVDASRLDVKGSQHPVADALITAKVKGMFIQQKLFGDRDIAASTIKVETNDGVVSLSGSSANKQQADTAIKIARSISGVKEVKSTIETPKS